MTKEEAIKEINLYKEFASDSLGEAFDVAIAAIDKLIKIEKWLEVQGND